MKIPVIDFDPDSNRLGYTLSWGGAGRSLCNFKIDFVKSASDALQ